MKGEISLDTVADMLQDGFAKSKSQAEQQFAQVHRDLSTIHKKLLTQLRSSLPFAEPLSQSTAHELI